MRFFSRRPMVSVVMAAYNHEAFVAKAASTVLEQTFGDLELIVVDDGSSDATPDVVASIKDKRIKLIRLPVNRAAHPRNLALAGARGHYIAFQNSDDEWQPTKLDEQVRAMEMDSSLSVCFTGTTIIDETGQAATGTWANGAFSTENRSPASWLRYFFDHGNCLPLPSALVRRAQLAAVGGFRASLVQLGDFDLWIQFAALGRFRIIAEALTDIRVVPNTNLSGPNPFYHRRSHFEHSIVLERYLATPLLDMFSTIFGDVSQAKSRGGQKVALAQHGLSRHGSIGVSFADRAIAAVLENADERADAVAEHGSDFIQGFLARRGDWALVQQGVSHR